MQKALKKVLVVGLFFFCVVKGNAQEKSGCFEKHQLLTMQTSSIEEIQDSLNKEEWSFDGVESDRSYSNLDDLINYNVASWKKSLDKTIGIVHLYNFSGKPNIIRCQTNPTCFNSLVKSFASINGDTSEEGDLLVKIFKENDITVEFREYKNDDSDGPCSILVYNSSASSTELDFLRFEAASNQSLPTEISVSVEDEKVKEEEVVEDEIFTIVDTMPLFPEGDKALFKYLRRNTIYPPLAIENGIKGMVVLNMVVEKDGSITDLQVLRGIGGGCEEEAMRVVKNMPIWAPGKLNGKPVRVKYVLPYRFILE